ncbi:glycerate kinase [Amycolatopsis sp. WAC 01375]|uniref:glycerate kinase n=1 Tax=unclassified Amycolatopsis TaxID=2618356 RepID=UPI000F779EA4|nr:MULTISPECIES: glycerate kinase [unclassified Amycolatopsis]RSM76312.1 glycerate kinase [Amycolatopsis sp. WAC 01375]RSN33468.1 glycerate kinase [Amycolatopsis sp. WAC 01416]
MTRVVIAPDKFKGSLTAVEAAEAIAHGVRDALPEAEVSSCPVADGGEGTLDVLVAAGGRLVELPVRGPLDETVAARYVTLDGTAYIESARACGIEFVEPSPEVALAAHTWGVGELLAHALDNGARRLVLTVGGTASTDGGAGMLAALGAGVFDAFGAPVGLGGGTLSRVALAELGPVRERLGSVEVAVATDVTNPLLGPRGAAAIFGPQKGAGPREVEQLDASLSRWAQALRNAGTPDVSDLPGAGAGGGVAAGAIAGLGASVESGFQLIAGLTGVADAIERADLVITGEGSLDEQSLDGKAPAGIAARAQEHAVPLMVLAGRIQLDQSQLAGLGVVGSAALIDHAPSLDHARAHAAELLRERAGELVRIWARG